MDKDLFKALGKGATFVGVPLLYIAAVGIAHRFSMNIFLFPCLILLWIAWRSKRIPFFPVLGFVFLFNLLLFLVPFDVGFELRGEFGVDKIPILWGKPTREGMARINNGECFPGGCVIPPNAAKEIILITL